MRVMTTNRSHRVAYMVLLLLAAVALTSALVLAGERSWGSESRSGSGRKPVSSQTMDEVAGLMGWRCA